MGSGRDAGEEAAHRFGPDGSGGREELPSRRTTLRVGLAEAPARTRMASGEPREERRRFGAVDGVARCAKPITTWSRGENLAVPTASPCGRGRTQPLVCSKEVSALLPRIFLHNEVSLDGRMDWFTPDVGLFYELASRWQEEATLAGSDTILGAGEPVPEEDEQASEPNPGSPGDTRPHLVVPESRGRVRIWHHLGQKPYWRCMVSLCSRSTPDEHLEYLKEKRVEVIVTGGERVDLRAALEELRDRHGVNTVRVDSGGTLNGVLLRAGLVDEVSLLVHPSLIGGISPAPCSEHPISPRLRAWCRSGWPISNSSGARSSG